MVNKLRQWFSQDAQHRIGIRVLQIAIGLAVLFRVCTELPFAEYFWGPNGLGRTSAAPIFGPLALLTDHFFTTVHGVYLILAIQACAAVALVAGAKTRIATVVLCITVISIEYRLHAITDGGDNIIRLALMYMVFMLPADARGKPGSLRVFVHNAAVVMMIVQALVMYFTTGIMKANGALWHQGTALYSISQVEWFSVESLRPMFRHSWVVVGASYATVMWQVWFPIGLFSRFRLAFVAVGLAFHLGIGVFMGLVCFSTVMVGLELFLVTDQEYVRIFAVLREGRARLRERVAWARPMLGREAA